MSQNKINEQLTKIWDDIDKRAQQRTIAILKQLACNKECSKWPKVVRFKRYDK